MAKAEYVAHLALAMTLLGAFELVGSAFERDLVGVTESRAPDSLRTRVTSNAQAMRVPRWLTSVVDRVRPLESRPYERTFRTVFDTETTGLPYDPNARVISFSGVRYRGDEPVQAYHFLIDPGSHVRSFGAEHVHKITRELMDATESLDSNLTLPSGRTIPLAVRKGSAVELYPEIVDAFRGGFADAYNARFDMEMMSRLAKDVARVSPHTYAQYGNPFAMNRGFDTQRLAFSGIFKKREFADGKINLVAVAERYGLKLSEDPETNGGVHTASGHLAAHNSLADSIAAGTARTGMLSRHWGELRSRFRDLPLPTDYLQATAGQLLELERRIAESPTYKALYEDRYSR